MWPWRLMAQYFKIRSISSYGITNICSDFNATEGHKTLLKSIGVSTSRKHRSKPYGLKQTLEHIVALHQGLLSNKKKIHCAKDIHTWQQQHCFRYGRPSKNITHTDFAYAKYANKYEQVNKTMCRSIQFWIKYKQLRFQHFRKPRSPEAQKVLFGAMRQSHTFTVSGFLKILTTDFFFLRVFMPW